jgi:hypothetical protein
MADLLANMQTLVGTVADDVVQLDSWFDRLLGSPTTPVAVPVTKPVPLAVATTPTTLTAVSSQTNVLLVAGVILLGLWLLK